ncbi:GNAT family N-acetyltransferase [Halobacillus yeomjeoni]|uniref:GNAT family N-acetyltransferase n=1 Tax=Halobacillus yeomjeoni TaxID=311194 RepID=A0A931MWC1_9BACI|nr:GNAT family N-acetyltransferase [Halobacillus yeomjeoni]MBH0231435.1 GNAT family N-acetyltransferase [Halobacillus yeomjeoni]
MKEYERHGEIKEIIKIEKMTVPTFVDAVLDGSIEGKVYTDNSSRTTILVETHNGIYFVGGSALNTSFNDELVNLYKTRKSDQRRFTLFSFSKEWVRTLRETLGDEVKQMQRYSYELSGGTINENVREIPKEYVIESITPKLIQMSEEFTEDYYEEYWGSVANFLKNGFGFCILHKGEVVSECTSIFCSKDYAEIDIATAQEYRGRGFASIAAHAFILHSLEKKMNIRWDCDISNPSSVRLAEKLGFRDPVEYSIFY